MLKVQSHADPMLLLCAECVVCACSLVVVYFFRSSAALSRQLKKVEAMKQTSRKKEKTMDALRLSPTRPPTSQSLTPNACSLLHWAAVAAAHNK